MRNPCRGCIHERSSSRSSPFGEPRLIGTSIHSLENDEVDRRARLSEKRASDCSLKPFATLTPGQAWGSSPFGVGLAHYDSRLLELCRSSDIHGTLEATKPRYASGALSRGFVTRKILQPVRACAAALSPDQTPPKPPRVASHGEADEDAVLGMRVPGRHGATWAAPPSAIG